MPTLALLVHHSRGAPREWLRRCLSAGSFVSPPHVVPWRDTAAEPAASEMREFMNASAEIKLQVRVLRSCACGLQQSAPRRVLPGDQLTVVRVQGCVRESCGEGLWYLRWFNWEGGEYVWPFVW